MPDYLPAHRELVYASGAAEMAGGAGLMVPRLRRLAGWWLIATLVAVFPANVWMAQHPERYPRARRARVARSRACRCRRSSSRSCARRCARAEQPVEDGVHQRGHEAPAERVAGQVAGEQAADQSVHRHLDVGPVA